MIKFILVISVYGLDEIVKRDLKNFRANFNESCNALDQAEECEVECFNKLVGCLIKCREGQSYPKKFTVTKITPQIVFFISSNFGE